MCCACVCDRPSRSPGAGTDADADASAEEFDVILFIAYWDRSDTNSIRSDRDGGERRFCSCGGDGGSHKVSDGWARTDRYDEMQWTPPASLSYLNTLPRNLIIATLCAKGLVTAGIFDGFSL